MTEFTLGKWDVVASNNQYLIMSGAKTVALIESWDTDEAEAEANAKLIASAPKMYTLLKMLADANPMGLKYKDTVLRVAQGARALIGEPPSAEASTPSAPSEATAPSAGYLARVARMHEEVRHEPLDA